MKYSQYTDKYLPSYVHILTNRFIITVTSPPLSSREDVTTLLYNWASIPMNIIKNKNALKVKTYADA